MWRQGGKKQPNHRLQNPGCKQLYSLNTCQPPWPSLEALKTLPRGSRKPSCLWAFWGLGWSSFRAKLSPEHNAGPSRVPPREVAPPFLLETSITACLRASLGLMAPAKCCLAHFLCEAYIKYKALFPGTPGLSVDRREMGNCFCPPGT